MTKTETAPPERLRIEMVDCERMILSEIEQPKVRRKTVAMTYAFCLRSSEDIDFSKVNRAIINRWSLSALDWIKKQAWSGRCFLD